MHVVRLDGSGIATREQFFDAIAAALEFPKYFGRNWDALDDCLLDIEVPTVVEWTESRRLAAADPEAYALALSCFADAKSPVELCLVGS